MALYDTTWYCNSVGWTAVAAWTANTAYAAGQTVRQLATPTVGNERVFVCIVAGNSHATTEPTWVITRGAKTTDNTVTWQEITGTSAMNGDLTNTVNWTTAKATGTPTLGAIIKRNNGASYQICTTAGTLSGSEPAFSDTAGVTTADGTTTWTSLGAVGNFTGGLNPSARFQVPFTNSTWFAAGHTLYVGDNHAETQTGQNTMQPTGSAATFGKILCHDHTGSYPPTAANLTTGASVTSSNAGIVFLPTSGNMYVRGVAFHGAGVRVGTGATNSVFEQCVFDVTGGNGSSTLDAGAGSAGTVVWNNCTVKFSATGQRFNQAMGFFHWKNTGPILVSGSSVPTNFMFQNTALSYAVLEALDLSQLTGTLVNNSAISNPGIIMFRDCKLNAAATISSTFGANSEFVQLINCDSAATNYKSTRHANEAVETTETSITRVGGAADPANQGQSRKIVTNAATKVDWLFPYVMEALAVYNSRVAQNVVVTVCGTLNSAVLPNNDEIWMEVEYLGGDSGNSPLGTIVSTTKATLLTAAAAVSSDGSSWNGGGSGAGWSPFKLTTTLNSPQPQLAGLINVRVKAAKASTTYYIDPKVTLT
jgi:hypothetical protein